MYSFDLKNWYATVIVKFRALKIGMLYGILHYLNSNVDNSAIIVESMPPQMLYFAHVDASGNRHIQAQGNAAGVGRTAEKQRY
jgi:hypothetical protein